MRGRAGALIGSLIFIAIAPGTVAGLIPYAITQWRLQSPFFEIPLTRVVGAIGVAAGVAIFLDSFLRFALQGRGTPSPVVPTEKLVVTGLYRYVRNPMYVAVLSIIVGQALLFGSVMLVAYAAVFGVLVVSFVRGYEEPTLARRYGAEYDAYRSAVPGWWPRRTPWRPDGTHRGLPHSADDERRV